MDLNQVFAKLGRPSISGKLSQYFDDDIKKRFFINKANQLVYAKSSRGYLDKIHDFMVRNDLKAYQIEDGYKLFGKPAESLSDMVKNDGRQRFKLNRWGEYELQPSRVSTTLLPAPVTVLNSEKVSTNPSSESKTSSGLFTYVEEVVQLQAIKDKLLATQPQFIALDVEFIERDPAIMAELALLQISYYKGDELVTIVFDTPNLGQYLKPVLETIIKSTVIVHDGRMEAVLLKHWYGISLARVLDTQIVYESVHKIPFAGLTKFLGLAKYSHVLKKHVHAKMDQGLVWKKPYSNELLQYAADDAELLLKATKEYCIDSRPAKLAKWIEQSTKYLQSISFPDLAKEMVFDDDLNIVSKCIFEGNDTKIEPINVIFEITELEPILPIGIFEALKELMHKNVRDLILDLNERPRVFFNDGTPAFLFDNPSMVFTQENVDDLVSHLEIGTDNRAILNGSFHRISVMRNLKDKIYGITIRMGRFVSGLTTILSDVIHSEDSLLFLGPPGTGKSSFIRDCIRMIGQKGKLLIVVDTSNELCGNGDFVHPLLYPARRLMVPKLEKQKDVMVEAVQNHTPDVLVIDEIGRANEVSASKTVKTRGVRVIASAHGSFDELFKNKDLNGLLGGFQQVILSDAMAKEQHDYRKLKMERAGEPVFDTIIELVKGSPGHVRILRDVKAKVDAKLENQKYVIEERWATGNSSMFVRLDSNR